MQHGTLHHTLKRCGRLNTAGWIVRNQAGQVFINILLQRLFQVWNVHLAGGHDFNGVIILGQSQQQVFQRRIFMLTLTSSCKGAFEGGFETRG